MADEDDRLTPEEELIDSSRHGDLEALRAVLALDPPPNVDAADERGTTALHMAAANGHTNCALLLIQKGAHHTPNTSGNTPLHWACLNKHLDVVKALLVAFPTIDVLAKNGVGRSALTEAFTGGNQDISSLLLEHPSAAALEEERATGTGGCSKVAEADDDGTAK